MPAFKLMLILAEEEEEKGLGKAWKNRDCEGQRIGDFVKKEDLNGKAKVGRRVWHAVLAILHSHFFFNMPKEMRGKASFVPFSIFVENCFNSTLWRPHAPSHRFRMLHKNSLPPKLQTLTLYPPPYSMSNQSKLDLWYKQIKSFAQVRIFNVYKHFRLTTVLYGPYSKVSDFDMRVYKNE